MHPTVVLWDINRVYFKGKYADGRCYHKCNKCRAYSGDKAIYQGFIFHVFFRGQRNYLRRFLHFLEFHKYLYIY